MFLRIGFLCLCIILSVRSQENAATSVAKSLIECYNKTENLDPEYRPPVTINVLLDLIRKIESGPSIQNDREFAIEIIHRFKQDGIVRTSTSTNTQYSIPYSPKDIQSDKHRLLLKKFIPGNALKFPNDTLSEVEKCSLHFMISNSVDVRVRGDEATACNMLGRYQRRHRRGANPNDEIEVFEPKSSPLKGNLQDGGEIEEEPKNPNEEVERGFQSADNTRKTTVIEESDCPVENGVVYTRWGPITPGSVIGAIAAARESQPVRSKEDFVSNNIFATTLAGDLAEVALHQGAAEKNKIILGLQGNFNNTLSPRWYFINSVTDWEMTAAEIRGGLDGLIIAKNIKAWKTKVPLLKLSQILDMYYSPKGVFSKRIRACNRQELFTEYAPREELLKETLAFSLLLDDVSKLSASISNNGVKVYSEKAVDALLEFVPSGLRDLRCGIEKDTIERASTDIIIALDTQWDYSYIHRTLSYLLDNIDVNKYASNYTIINAKTGEILLDSTASIVDFHINYNSTRHYLEPTGFDANQAFRSIDQIVKNRMGDDKLNKRAGGKSTIVLFVIYNVLTQGDKSSASSNRESFRSNLPDVKLLAMGRGSKDAYSDLVIDSVYDTFGLPEFGDGTSLTQSVDAVIERIKQIPRKIINPNCGPNWSGSSSSFSFDQYIEPNSINYYRVAPHYFFGEGTKTIEIQGYSYGNLIACTSRQNARPSQNFTQGDISCQPITGNGKASFSLTDGCSSYDTASQCSPVYISVQAPATESESTNPRCNDAGCRFPDDIKYTVKSDGLGCESGALQIIANCILLISVFFVVNFTK